MLLAKEEMIMENDIYKRLAKHVSALGMGYPEKEELLEIFKENFTPQEAEVALAIPTKVIPLEPTPVSAILPRLNSPRKIGIHPVELSPAGLLFSKVEEWRSRLCAAAVWLRVPSDFLLERRRYAQCKKDGRADPEVFR
jgi:hypothetical protein